ncbi:hypothetical protein P7C73_g4593, partial [Tremellales sp. Uapishka_1]
MSRPPPVPSNSRPAYQNPFYTASPPPTYTPPVPARQEAPPPQQYSSLADLNRGNASQAKEYSYVPQPERQGYSNTASFEHGSSSGRRVPPLPAGYTGPPPKEPPRRTPAAASPAAPVDPFAPPAPPPSRFSQAATTAQSYIPVNAQNHISNTASKVMDSVGGIATQERKAQVYNGVAKVGAGAFKLAGKGVWALGKAASK